MGVKAEGKRVRQEREAIGMTREELASGLGKSRSTVAAYERGDRRMPDGVRNTIAQMLHERDRK